MRKTLLLSLVIIPFIYSCGPSKTKLSGEIKNMENSLYAASNTGFDKAKADSLFNLYLKYIEKFPGDTMAARYTFNAASLAMNMEKGIDAINLFDQFIKNNPDNPRTPVCMFFKAYVYENQVKDLEKAKEVYLNFIEKYPQSDFADDAQNSLNNLGKSAEEMVAEFEKRQKEDSLKNAVSQKK